MTHNREPIPPQEPDPTIRAIDDVANTMGGGAGLTQEVVRGDTTVLYVQDSNGEDIGSPAIPGSLVVDGKNGISGIMYYTAERDDSGRPTKITGFRTGDGLAGLILQGLAESIAKIDGTQASEDEEPATEFDFNSGGHEEIELRYDSRTGLLSEVVETFTEGDTVRKTVHTNYFGDDGRRTGYVKRELVDIVAAGKDEVYDTTELRLYERADGVCRETTYIGYRDGLIPFGMSEYGPDFKIRQRIYLTDLGRTERLPYVIAANPTEMHLTLFANGEYRRDEQVTLPSWLPKDAVHELACGVVAPADTAEAPTMPEAEGKTLIDVDTAISNANALQSERQAADFINGMMTGDEVIVHQGNGLRIDEGFITRTMRETYFGRMPEYQKLALLAVLHPAFGQVEASIDEMAIAVDKMHSQTLLKILNMNTADVRRTMYGLADRGDGLNPQSRHRFEYLLPEE